MFKDTVYKERRAKLKSLVKSGLVILPGNTEAAFNYPSNTYKFRQDSSFLYFFGLDHPNLAGVIDIDQNKDIIFGNDVDMDDIIWMGPQPTLTEQAVQVGVSNTLAFNKIETYLKEAIKKGRKVHFLPPYRGETKFQLENWLGIHHEQLENYVSEELIKAVVKLRLIKSEEEIAEIEKAVNITREMHITAMKMAHPGVYEREIAGAIEGIALAHGGQVSFPIILSINGQTLHNHYHGNLLEKGRMMVTDAGAETEMHYAGDITRTVPVGGTFDQRQKDIYQIVLDANTAVTKNIKADITYKSMHLLASKIIAQGLKDLDLMKGDVEEAVKQGAHALFCPHGLGHAMGLDVHDMEGLGEDYVGYDNEVKRSSQFGLAFLRMARRLQSGFVITNEPGIYFIPALIEQWQKENKFTQFINYDKVNSYKDFGGIRIEDDILVTSDGCKVLGKPIPKTIDEIEETMKK